MAADPDLINVIFGGTGVRPAGSLIVPDRTTPSGTRVADPDLDGADLALGLNNLSSSLGDLVLQPDFVISAGQRAV